MIMCSAYRIEMEIRKSALASSQRLMPGYIDGLVIDLVSLYTRAERELLMARLLELGIVVGTTYTMRRTSRRSQPELVIANKDLPAAFELLKPHLFEEYYHLFDAKYDFTRTNPHLPIK